MCYYCGDCSETCPRQADPGEVMMGLRRYLTSLYDWTGISRLFYTSKTFEVMSVLLISALVGLGFYFFHGPMPTLKEMEKFLIDKALETANGNQTIAAGLLGISRKALNNRLIRSK